MTEKDEVPRWFRQALSVPSQRRSISVAGCQIVYRLWGDEGPLVLLVHGRGAHSRWWDHIAPHLADNARIAAIDLSGHGDSGRRADYGYSVWADDVAAVIQGEGGGPAIIVGHSMGGSVALTLASDGRLPSSAFVAIDTPVGVPHTRGGPQTGLPKVYENRIDAENRFRVLPSNSVAHPYIERHIARHSVREVQGGWGWKADASVLPRVQKPIAELGAPEAKVMLLLAERGLATSETTSLVAARFGDETVIATILDSGHHIMVDQPIALISVLRLFISSWQSGSGK